VIGPEFTTNRISATNIAFAQRPLFATTAMSSASSRAHPDATGCSNVTLRLPRAQFQHDQERERSGRHRDAMLNGDEVGAIAIDVVQRAGSAISGIGKGDIAGLEREMGAVRRLQADMVARAIVLRDHR
jgi:hypothetical protein